MILQHQPLLWHPVLERHGGEEREICVPVVFAMVTSIPEESVRIWVTHNFPSPGRSLSVLMDGIEPATRKK